MRKESVLREAQYLSGIGRNTEAYLLLESHMDNSGVYEITYIYKMAEINIEEKSYISALPLLIRCLSLSESTNFKNYVFLSQIRLFQIKYFLGHEKESLELLQSLIPHINTSGELYTKGLAHLVLAQMGLENSENILLISHDCKLIKILISRLFQTRGIKRNEKNLLLNGKELSQRRNI
jgi:hypothetical protein